MLEINATDLSTDSSDGPQTIRNYRTLKLAVVVGEHDVVLDDVLLNVLKPGEKQNFLCPE